MLSHIVSKNLIRRRALGLMFLAPVVLLGGTAFSAERKDTEIHIDNFSFSPVTVTVTVGSTVAWLNRDDIPHTVVDTGSPPAFKSHALDTDQSFAFTFTAAGTYTYFCSLHPHMQGTIVVK